MTQNDEAVREAEAWFRERPERVEEVRGGENLFMVTAAQRHAATIVRAWLARDVPAPVGRDLTAKDAEPAPLTPLGSDPMGYGEDRIARPSGGAGQPDTAEPRIPTAAEIVDEYEASQLDDRSPRSWSLPAPPPDDVTVEGRGTEGLLRDLAGVLNTHGVDAHLNLHDFVLAKHAYESLLTLGSTVSYERTVVEGEPPAPEPVTVLAGEFCPLDGCTAEGRMHTHERADYDRAVQQAHEPAPEPQAAEPPRFSRGFYRLARDLDVGPDWEHFRDVLGDIGDSVITNVEDRRWAIDEAMNAAHETFGAAALAGGGPMSEQVPNDVAHRWMNERDMARDQVNRLRFENAALRDAGNALAHAARRYAGFGGSSHCRRLLDEVTAWRSAAGTPTTDEETQR